MTLRRLWVLVSKLPLEARCNQLLFGDAARWTPEQSRHEQLSYLIAHGNWQRGGGKGEKPKKPKAPRPPELVRIDLPDDI